MGGEAYEDPFKLIIYSECVNSKKSPLANALGFIDYYDRLLSRKF